MRLVFTLLVPIFLTPILAAQKFYASNHPDYISNVDSADFYFDLQQYEKAQPYYEKALAVDDYSFLSKFRLAICHFEKRSKQGNTWLAKCSQQNWANICDHADNEYIAQLQNYSELVDWQQMEAICKIQHSKLDSQLMEVLMEIDKFDQGIRRGDLTEEDFKASQYYHSEMGMWEVDSINLKRMTQIFDEYGYPGRDIVGPFLSYTGYLVLQHADQRPDIQEKYFGMLKEAVNNHQVHRYTIAYLNDRIKVNKGECQDFGTQIGYSEDHGYFVRPINDIENLDKRRQEYHIKPINDYLANWGLTLSKEDACKE